MSIESHHLPPDAREELDPVVAAYMRDVDVALLRENLKLTHEQRLLNLIELQRFAEELRAAGRAVEGR